MELKDYREGDRVEIIADEWYPATVTSEWRMIAGFLIATRNPEGWVEFIREPAHIRLSGARAPDE